MASLPASVSGGMAGRLSGSCTTTSASLWHRIQAASGRWMISPIQGRAMQSINYGRSCKYTGTLCTAYQSPVEPQAVPASDQSGVPATAYRMGKLPLLAEAAPLSEVHFRLLQKPNEDAFSMYLGTDITLAQVVDMVAGRIGLDDPKQIRIRPGSASGPIADPFEYGTSIDLKAMLAASFKMGTTHVLYYDVVQLMTNPTPAGHASSGGKIWKTKAKICASPYQRMTPLSSRKLALVPTEDPLCAVHFRMMDKPDEDIFCLELGIETTLAEVVHLAAGRIGIDDPTRIRVRPGPVTGPFENDNPIDLKTMLVTLFKMGYPHVLYIELLETKTVQITFHSMMGEVSTYKISLWRDFTAKNVLNALKPMVKLANPDAEVKLLKYSIGHSFKLYKDEDYVAFADFADHTPYSLHAHEHYGGPYEDVVVNMHLLKMNMDGTLKSREYFYIFLHSYEKTTVEEIKMQVQDEINWAADLKSRLLYMSPSKSFEILDSHILCDLFQSQPSRDSQEYLQWEIFETEKRKREKSEDPPSPKKLKSSFDIEPTCRRGTRFSGPTEEEEEALERCIKHLEAGPEMVPSMAQLDPIWWAQLDPIETHLEDVGAHSSEGFGSPVYFPSSPVSDVKAGDQRDNGKGIMYIC